MDSKNFKAPEREISISQLLWKCLRSWRGIIISAVGFALLIGGLQYARNVKSVADGVQVETIEQLQQKLTEKEQRELIDAEKKKKHIKEKEEYQKQSVLMNIDPYNKSVVTLQYYVDTNYKINLSEEISRDNTKDIVEAYNIYIGNRNLIISIDGADKYTVELVSSGASPEAGTFIVFVAGKDKESAEELAEKVNEAIVKYQKVIVDTVGEHDLKLIGQQNSIFVDTELANRQQALDKDISNLYSDLETLTASFTAAQLQILNGETDKGQDDNTAEVKVTVSKKHIVLGGIIGIFFYVMWITLCFIFGKRIKNAEELQEMYMLRILGAVKRDKEQKAGLLQRIDRWIEHLQCDEKWTYEEGLSFAITNIAVCCKKEKIENILLATSLHLDESDKQVVLDLKNGLESRGITVQVGEYLVRNVESLELMGDITNTVFVEKKEHSKYSDIEQELRIGAEQNANILGMIVFE